MTLPNRNSSGMAATSQDLSPSDALGVLLPPLRSILLPVFTVDEAKALRGHIPGCHIKNFLKDKREQLWLVVCPEDRPVDLKTLPALIGSARLSFALSDQVLGVEPVRSPPSASSMTPPGRVAVILDAAMMHAECINCHPLRNTATTSIAAAGLIAFIRACGRSPGWWRSADHDSGAL